MRMLPFSILVLTLSTGLSQAQTTPRPPATPPLLDPDKNELDRYLLQWEKTISNIDTFAARCGWTEKSPTTGRTETYKGTLHFERDTRSVRFLLHVNKIDENGKTDQTDYRRFLSTGTYLYQYDPAQKQVHVYNAMELSQGKQQTALEFFVSMNAANAKRRFDMKLAKQDKHYLYVDIFPKDPADKAEFVQARIVLVKATMIPRQVWFKMVNSEEVLWDVPVLKSGVKIPAGTFQKPNVKAPWKLVRPQQAKKVGRKIRNQNP